VSCRYIIIIKITGAAASTYSLVQADPTGIQVVVADPTGKTDFTGWTATQKQRTKEFQILILAEAAILKKNETKKRIPSVRECSDLG
jgi:hypothetical protein